MRRGTSTGSGSDGVIAQLRPGRGVRRRAIAADRALARAPAHASRARDARRREPERPCGSARRQRRAHVVGGVGPHDDAGGHRRHPDRAAVPARRPAVHPHRARRRSPRSRSPVSDPSRSRSSAGCCSASSRTSSTATATTSCRASSTSSPGCGRRSRSSSPSSCSSSSAASAGAEARSVAGGTPDARPPRRTPDAGGGILPWAIVPLPLRRVHAPVVPVGLGPGRATSRRSAILAPGHGAGDRLPLVRRRHRPRRHGEPRPGARS